MLITSEYVSEGARRAGEGPWGGWWGLFLKLVMKKKIYFVPVMKVHELQHKGNMMLEASGEAAKGLDPNSGLGLDWQEGGFEDEEGDN